MMEPLDAKIHLAFAFDVGYEIDLEQPRNRSSRSRPASFPAAGAHARIDPATALPRYDSPSTAATGMKHSRAGLAVDPGRSAPSFRVFDFGAISLMVHVPRRGDRRGR